MKKIKSIWEKAEWIRVTIVISLVAIVGGIAMTIFLLNNQKFSASLDQSQVVVSDISTQSKERTSSEQSRIDEENQADPYQETTPDKLVELINKDEARDGDLYKFRGTLTAKNMWGVGDLGFNVIYVKTPETEHSTGLMMRDNDERSSWKDGTIVDFQIMMSTFYVEEADYEGVIPEVIGYRVVSE